MKEQFWGDVIEAWCSFNYRRYNKMENQIIWYNSDIRINGKPFFWKENYKRGLKYVYQLYKNKKFKN